MCDISMYIHQCQTGQSLLRHLIYQPSFLLSISNKHHPPSNVTRSGVILERGKGSYFPPPPKTIATKMGKYIALPYPLAPSRYDNSSYKSLEILNQRKNTIFFMFMRKKNKNVFL